MRTVAIYVVIVCVSTVLVINPAVVYWLTGLRSFALYVALLDLWLAITAAAAVLYLKRGRAGYFWLTLGALAALPPVMLAGEIGYTLFRHQYADRLLGQIAPIYRDDPQLIYTHLPNARGRHVSMGNFDVTYETDALGRKKIEPSPDARWSVHVFGDSFAFGFGVANRDTWLNLLARKLQPEANVFNYGVVGYGLEQMYLSLERHRDQIRPGDLVIFAPVADDLARGLAGRHYVCGGQIRAERSEMFPKFEDGAWTTVRLSDECSFLLDTVLANSPFPIGFGALYRSLTRQSTHRAMIDEADRIFALAADLAAAQDARFEVVFLATPEECRRNALSIALDRLQTSYRSLMPYCPDHPAEVEALKFPHDGHWNPTGHRWAADALYDLLFGPVGSRATTARSG